MSILCETLKIRSRKLFSKPKILQENGLFMNSGKFGKKKKKFFCYIYVLIAANVYLHKLPLSLFLHIHSQVFLTVLFH